MTSMRPRQMPPQSDQQFLTAAAVSEPSPRRSRGKRELFHRSPDKGERGLDSTRQRRATFTGRDHRGSAFLSPLPGLWFVVHPHPQLALWAGFWSPLPRLQLGGRLDDGSTRRGRESFASYVFHLESHRRERLPTPLGRAGVRLECVYFGPFLPLQEIFKNLVSRRLTLATEHLYYDG